MIKINMNDIDDVYKNIKHFSKEIIYFAHGLIRLESFESEIERVKFFNILNIYFSSLNICTYSRFTKNRNEFLEESLNDIKENTELLFKYTDLNSEEMGEAINEETKNATS